MLPPRVARKLRAALRTTPEKNRRACDPQSETLDARARRSRIARGSAAVLMLAIVVRERRGFTASAVAAAIAVLK